MIKALDYFASLVQDDEQIPLFEAALSIAQDDDPGLDLTACQLEIDKLLMDDFYGVTIFQFPAVTAFSDRVTNVDPGPLSPTIFWNAWDWEPTETN